MSVEQLGAEIALQAAQPPAEGRLGNSQDGRGVGHVLVLGQDEEPGEVVGKHVGIMTRMHQKKQFDAFWLTAVSGPRWWA